GVHPRRDRGVVRGDGGGAQGRAGRQAVPADRLGRDRARGAARRVRPRRCRDRERGAGRAARDARGGRAGQTAQRGRRGARGGSESVRDSAAFDDSPVAAHGEAIWPLPAAAPDRWLEAGRVIVATGGLSFPRTGSDGTGYALLTALGHTLEPPVPALTPLAS